MRLPALLAVTIMTATAVGFFGESFFLGVSTAGPMILLGRWGLLACRRVDVNGAELLATFPTPGAAAASANCKNASCL